MLLAWLNKWVSWYSADSYTNSRLIAIGDAKEEKRKGFPRGTQQRRLPSSIEKRRACSSLVVVGLDMDDAILPDATFFDFSPIKKRFTWSNGDNQKPHYSHVGVKLNRRTASKTPRGNEGTGQTGKAGMLSTSD